MTKEDLRELREDIIGFQLENLEAKFQMFKEYLGSFFTILLNKGFNGNFLGELKLIHNEFQLIMSEENKLFREILRKASKKDLDAIDMLILRINDLNEKTISYYYELLDDIENDSEREYSHEYRRIPRDFKTLIEFYDFRDEVVGLTLSMDDIKKFLDYEDDFWKFIQPRIKIDDNPYFDFDNKSKSYGTTYDREDINSLSIYIPKIVDLSTSMIVLRELILAHSVYSKDFDSIGRIDSIAYGEESNFKDKYIPKKNKRLFQ